MIRMLDKWERPHEVVLRPGDHGRLLTADEWEHAQYDQQGFIYEIIDGVVNVSPFPPPPHDYWVNIVSSALRDYSGQPESAINYVSQACDVLIPGRRGVTRPQPDIAAFRRFPNPFPSDWDDVCPLIVVEVISTRRAAKDTVRNRHLYWLARRISEYWIVDPQRDEFKPTLLALQRTARAKEWKESVVTYGEDFASKALPGFVLNLRQAARRWG